MRNWGGQEWGVSGRGEGSSVGRPALVEGSLGHILSPAQSALLGPIGFAPVISQVQI